MSKRSAVFTPFFAGQAIPQSENFGELLHKYSGYVYTLASMNARTVAKIPLRLYAEKNVKDTPAGFRARGVTTKQYDKLLSRGAQNSPALFRRINKATELVEITEHPFLDLMTRVNKFYNNRDLIEILTLHEELTGNGYWYPVLSNIGTPVEIWPISPRYMTVLPDAERFIKGYQYKQGTKKAVVFDESEIVHFKRPHPDNNYYGFGPLQACVAPYQHAENADEYTAALFRNMGMMGGFFEVDAVRPALSDESFERLKNELLSVYAGVANAGKIGLLDPGLHFNPTQLNPVDMALMVVHNLSEKRIANTFGVPLAKLDKDANLASSYTAERQYQQDTIKPILVRDEEKLNEKLLPMWDERLFVAFDENVPADRDFQLKENVEYTRSNIWTINEVRASQGKDPVEWGDEPPQPANPFSGLFGSGSEPADPKKHFHRRTIQSRADDEPADDAADEGEVRRTKAWHAFIRAVSPKERDFRDSIRQMFRDQQAEMLANMKHAGTGKVKEPGDINTWMFGHATWLKRFENVGADLIKAVVLFNGERTMGNLPVAGIGFDVTNQRAVDWIAGKAFKFADETMNTLEADLQAALSEGIAEGETVTQLRKRVEGIYDGYTSVDEPWKAERIARTEVIGASNYGANEAYQQVNDAYPDTVQGIEWVATRDDRTRDSHMALDGQVIDIGKTFANGLHFPGDPESSDAGEVINCRCTSAPVLKDIAEGN